VNKEKKKKNPQSLWMSPKKGQTVVNFTNIYKAAFSPISVRIQMKMQKLYTFKPKNCLSNVGEIHNCATKKNMMMNYIFTTAIHK